MQSFRLLNPKGHILGIKQGLKGVFAPHFGLYHRFEISSPLIGRKFGSKDYQFNTYFCIDEPSFAAIGINMIYWVEYHSKIGRNCIWSILTTQIFNQLEAWQIEISGRATNEGSFESVWLTDSTPDLVSKNIYWTNCSWAQIPTNQRAGNQEFMKKGANGASF